MEFTNLSARIRKSLVGVASLVLLSGASAHATLIDWNTWTSSTAGTMGSIAVTFNAGGSPANLYPGDYPSYTPTSTFADGTIVSNAPAPSNRILQLFGGYPDNINTVHFSTPVVNPVMAIWSLGQANPPNVDNNSMFVFNTPAIPTFVAGGPSSEYAGIAITVLGQVVSGKEANGTVQFLGTFSDISWTNPVEENWYGFNVGTPVPEPGTMMLLGAGLLGLAVYGKRRKKA